MKDRIPHIIALKGFSNSGKTTSLESVVKFLTSQDKKVAVIKHIHQDNFTIDQKGKDTWKMRNAGGDPIVSYSNDEIAFLTNHKLDMENTLGILASIRPDLDYVFLEGFWENSYPKILFIKNLEELENLIEEILHSPMGNNYLQSTFCLSGTYFVSGSYHKKAMMEKFDGLVESGILPKPLKKHIASLPILNIKDHPEKFLKIFQSLS